MQYEWAQPGRLVVCIDGARHTDRPDVPGEIMPTKGIIYTVRDVTKYARVGIRLVELVNEPRRYAEGVLEVSFGLNRFRPVNTQIIDALLKVEENA